MSTTLHQLLLQAKNRIGYGFTRQAAQHLKVSERTITRWTVNPQGFNPNWRLAESLRRYLERLNHEPTKP